MDEIIRLFHKIVMDDKDNALEIRRKNFYVEKKFQRNFILYYLIVVLTLIFFSGIAFYFFFNNIIEHSLYTIHPKVQSVRDIIVPNLMLFFVLMTLIALITIIFVANVIFKKVGKSFEVYKKVSERIKSLDFKDASMINIDSAANLSKSYNDLIEKYSNDVKMLRDIASQILEIFNKLEENNITNNMEKEHIIDKLMILKNSIGATLENFIVKKII